MIIRSTTVFNAIEMEQMAEWIESALREARQGNVRETREALEMALRFLDAMEDEDND
jgi:chemotaxis protein histidine kinase CheA